MTPPLPQLPESALSRYSRHLLLPTFGIDNQKVLSKSRVLVVGAGGLGSPLLQYLAAMGVGVLGVVDGDTVDVSNLQRQIIHSEGTVGVNKAVSAMKRITEINSETIVKTYESEMTSSNAEEIMAAGWDVIVDGSDNFPTKYLLSDLSEMYSVPFVYGGVLGFDGQVSVFNYPPSVGPSYRDYLPEPPNPENIPSCAEGGVLGAVPGVIGMMQCVELVKVLVNTHVDAGGEGVRMGKVREDLSKCDVKVYEALEGTWKSVIVERIVGREPPTQLVDYVGFCRGADAPPAPKAPEGARTMDEAAYETVDTSSGDFSTISPKQVMQKMLDGWNPYVIDVRIKPEEKIARLPFTDALIPHRDVMPEDLPLNRDILFFCKGGVRSNKVCKRAAKEFGLPNAIYEIEGGIMGWKREIDASIPKY
ncbi:hypothetical protein TrVE_jg3423 [Triparma verrucosa]|nr:hypothetical protein TrST_g8151 [Triparma strigata]GMI03098.1 hypothetical protein TrVE_jg3423 [Triparma verrucosa]